MILDYADLESGQVISRHSYMLDRDMVEDYIMAVQDDSPTIADGNGDRLVPAMAVAALSLRGVVEDLRIPGGTLHTGQEFEFSQSVSIGSGLECVATLAQNSVRGEWRFLTVNCRATRDDGEPVMTGKSSIMIPSHLGPRKVSS